MADTKYCVKCDEAGPTDDYLVNFHSRFAYSCDLCGHHTNHWHKVGDLAVCQTCFASKAWEAK